MFVLEKTILRTVAASCISISVRLVPDKQGKFSDACRGSPAEVEYFVRFLLYVIQDCSCSDNYIVSFQLVCGSLSCILKERFITKTILRAKSKILFFMSVVAFCQFRIHYYGSLEP
jgi:hypothetical protein